MCKLPHAWIQIVFIALVPSSGWAQAESCEAQFAEQRNASVVTSESMQINAGPWIAAYRDWLETGRMDQGQAIMRAELEELIGAIEPSSQASSEVSVEPAAAEAVPERKQSWRSRIKGWIKNLQAPPSTEPKPERPLPKLLRHVQALTEIPYSSIVETRGQLRHIVSDLVDVLHFTWPYQYEPLAFRNVNNVNEFFTLARVKKDGDVLLEDFPFVWLIITTKELSLRQSNDLSAFPIFIAEAPVGPKEAHSKTYFPAPHLGHDFNHARYIFRFAYRPKLEQLRAGEIGRDEFRQFIEARARVYAAFRSFAASQERSMEPIFDLIWAAIYHEGDFETVKDVHPFEMSRRGLLTILSLRSLGGPELSQVAAMIRVDIDRGKYGSKIKTHPSYTVDSLERAVQLLREFAESLPDDSSAHS